MNDAQRAQRAYVQTQVSALLRDGYSRRTAELDPPADRHDRAVYQRGRQDARLEPPDLTVEEDGS